MPVASLAAQLSAPVLFVESSGVSPATACELRRIGRPSIYVIGPSSVASERVERQLGRFGHVTRIAGANPVTNAIAVARFAEEDRSLHARDGMRPGLVFGSATANHFNDAPPAAILSAVGGGPLMLVESPNQLSRALLAYIRELHHAPRLGGGAGAHRHGWVIGAEDAISTHLQALIGDRLN